jgi:methanogenic corrinoid protein MtbC1
MDGKIITMMADLDEDVLFDEIRSQLQAGVPAEKILGELQAGMTEVGRRFETQEYFLSELILSGELFKEAVECLGFPAKAQTIRWQRSL